MTVTFLVALDLEDSSPESLEIEASNMDSTLEGAGFPVISVAHWQRPATAPTPALSVGPPKDQLT